MRLKRRKLKDKNLSYAVVGLGRFGTALAIELCSKGVDVLVADSDPDKIRTMRELTENAFVVDCANPIALRKIGIGNCDIAIVCLASEIDKSILITLDLVNLGIPKVIAKASSAEHGIILKKIGAEVVYPEKDMALRLANRLENSKTLDYVKLSERVNISKIKVTDKGKNKTIIDLKIRKRFGCNIIAIESGTEVIDNVDPNFKLHKNDIIYVTGTQEHLDSLVKHI